MTYLPSKPPATGSVSIPITATYAAAGAIAITDSFAVVNLAADGAMTLANGAVDGHEIVIKRLGAGAVTVAAIIDGAAQTLIMSNARVKESLTLRWSAALQSYLLLDVFSIPSAPVGLTMTQPPAWRIHQRTTLTGGANGKGRGSIPLAVSLSLPAANLDYRLRDASTAAVLQDWMPCAYNVPAGPSTVTCSAVPAYLGWYLVDLRANQDNNQVVLGTNKVGLGRIIGTAGQSEIARIFGRMDGETATNASLGIAISPYSSCYGTYTDSIRSVSTATWAPPADGGNYDSSACSELLRLQVAASGVPCALVGYGNGGTQINSWLPGAVNWNTLQANLGAAGGAYEAFVWCQGASDYQTDSTEYRRRLAQFYDGLDAANSLGAGAVHIDSHIQPINNPNFGTFAQMLAIRRAHRTYAAQHATNAVYVPLTDVDTCTSGNNVGLEISMAGYVTTARHWHRAMRPGLGLPGVGVVGPTMTKPSLSGAVITIPVTQAGGTALSGVGNWWTRFAVYDAGTLTTPLTVSSGTLAAAAITLTLSATPAGHVDVYFDKNPSGQNINSTLMVYDNNAADGDGLTTGRQLTHNGTPLGTAPLAAATPVTLTGATYDTTAPRFGTGALNGGTGTLPYSGLPVAQPFTVECWGKTAAPGSAVQALFGSAYAWVGVATNGTATGTAGQVPPITTIVQVADGAWHHFAITVANNYCTIWVDGQPAGGSATTGWAVPTSGSFGVRQFDAQGAETIFAGEIDEMIVTANEKYVGAFVPVTGPVTGTEFGSYAVYHLDGNGTGIGRSATATAVAPITLAAATYDTATPKFGSAALNGGTGTIPYGNVPQAQPFTVECWVKTSAAGSAIQAPFGSAYAWVGIATDGTLTGASGQVPPATTTVNIATGTWRHLAIVVAGGNYTIWADGTQAATGPATGWVVPATGAFGVRQFDTQGADTVFAGEIDELILSSYAKYTATFTPATSAAVSGTDSGRYAVYHLDGNGNGVA